MTPEAFLSKAVPLAFAAGSRFPGYQCCEAAEESAWGESELARLANNLFGQKQGHTTAGQAVIVLPTREYVVGRMVPTSARFVKFESWQASFAGRMELLEALAEERLPSGACRFPGYAFALDSFTGEDFITNVSKDWSTDPNRAQTVLDIYEAHRSLIEQLCAAGGIYG